MRLRLTACRTRPRHPAAVHGREGQDVDDREVGREQARSARAGRSAGLPCAPCPPAPTMPMGPPRAAPRRDSGDRGDDAGPARHDQSAGLDGPAAADPDRRRPASRWTMAPGRCRARHVRRARCRRGPRALVAAASRVIWRVPSPTAWTVRVTRSPACASGVVPVGARGRRSTAKVWPSTAVIRSPAWRPIAAAGVPRHDRRRLGRRRCGSEGRGDEGEDHEGQQAGSWPRPPPG